MTCVVAFKHEGDVWMGADSAGVDTNLGLVTRKDPKIYRVGEFLLGFTSSFRMGQLLGHALNVSKRHPSISVELYMATTFIDAVRHTLKAGGYARIDNGEESGGTFLVAYEGRIFNVSSDFQVGESVHDYDAVGCGAAVALGALHAMSYDQNVAPHRMIFRALAAAECFSAGVRAPYLFKRLNDTEWRE